MCSFTLPLRGPRAPETTHWLYGRCQKKQQQQQQSFPHEPAAAVCVGTDFETLSLAYSPYTVKYRRSFVFFVLKPSETSEDDEGKIIIRLSELQTEFTNSAY